MKPFRPSKKPHMTSARKGGEDTDAVRLSREPSDHEGSAGAGKPTENETDTVFRVALPPADRSPADLEQFYRETVMDLLGIVRFYFKGEPVCVDSFAFINRPEKQIRILREDENGKA